MGTFQANPWWAAVATLGVILAAWYLLTAVRKMIQGPLDEEKNGHLTDLGKREIAVLVPLVILFFVIGLYPNYFLDKINPAVDVLLQTIQNSPPPF